ncbi:dehydrogenase E1 and transketolase domain-containing protein 1 [Lyophyllum atratum]|nr:dehydrogenase E1 and transketolase domain-containing protein 1 [Lyophyllum atratum]
MSLLSPLRARLPVQALRARGYHDESFGFRKRREYVFPDYTEAQLENRHINAPLLRYVDSMRTHGHRAAHIDPLDIIHREEVAALDPKRYGLSDDSKKYNVNGIIWTKPLGQSHSSEEWWTLREITRHLRSVYVGRIAHEYMHSPSKTERLWFSHLLESESLPSSDEPPITIVNAEMKRRIHELLARSEVLDNFLQLKFPNLKRYGLEGGESMIPALDSLFSSASNGGIQHIILGMPHRGRLNLLTDLLQYSPTALFNKIKGNFEIPEELGAEGDVLSHLVASPTLNYGTANPLKVSMLPNPSHLGKPPPHQKAVNPVALGKTRAKQYALLKTSPEDCELGDRVMCVQLHGDASFTGQGVIMEGLGLSNLPHFTSGGTVHLVVDSPSIGYTTPASNARSSLYCSDVGKMINAPVLHVNGDYPEDVVRAMDIAFQYRKYFRKDIIVDLLVYRRWCVHIHNELDLPGITSPLMYEHISARRSVPQIYEEKLKAEEILTETDIADVRSAYKSHLDTELSKVASFVPQASMLEDQWKGIVWPASKEAEFDPETGVDQETLVKIGRASVAVPDGFEVHPKLHRHIKNRLKSIESGSGVDWATAEALAFGSLMLEGNDVRISGQDVGRGTFSQRHAMLVNQKTEGVIVPLNDELEAPGKLELANSSLSEMAVLGFEYGTSWERPNILPIWEAQFGDFFNGAQIIIDTYVVSSETKWLKQSGMVMLLPHGLDGAGPEHSSSRIERMLQLSDDPYVPNPDNAPSNVNIHVVFPTTPAQYFHLLRRQLKRNFRKPLIVAGPKGLLRLSAAASSLSELGEGTRFQPVLDDPIVDPSQVKRVVLVTGKLYYDLIKERETSSAKDSVAFVRLEELSPFPFAELAKTLERYTRATEYFYLQEEPKNQGAYAHVKSRIGGVFEGMGYEGKLEYRGRKESAVPAPGVGRLYAVQQKAVIQAAFEGL